MIVKYKNTFKYMLTHFRYLINFITSLLSKSSNNYFILVPMKMIKIVIVLDLYTFVIQNRGFHCGIFSYVYKLV